MYWGRCERGLVAHCSLVSTSLGLTKGRPNGHDITKHDMYVR